MKLEKLHAFGVRKAKAKEKVGDEGAEIRGKDYSYWMWTSHKIHQMEGLKKCFFPSK